MSIYILSDPNIVDFVPEKNHQEIAMVKALNQKRIPVKLLAGMEDTPALLNDPSAMLLISHTLANEHRDILAFCNQHRVPVIALHSFSDTFPDYAYDTISDNFRLSMAVLLNYFFMYDKKRICFFYLNPYSPHDMKRCESLYDMYSGFHRKDIFPATADGLEAVFQSFFSNCREYDAIICPNDFIAIALINELKRYDPAYLKQCFIVGTMNTIISNLYSPSLTTCSYSTQSAIRALSWIHQVRSKNPDLCMTLNVSLYDDLVTRESTGNLPFETSDDNGIKYPSLGRRLPLLSSDIPKIRPFENEPILSEIINLENMLRILSVLELQILQMLLEKQSNAAICEKHFITPQTLQYHLNQMLKFAKIHNKKEFIQTASKYIHLDNLKDYIARLHA